jgi:hypothetical protein
VLDVLIVGGQVHDGCGSPPVPADVGIADDRIAVIGPAGSIGADAALVLTLPDAIRRMSALPIAGGRFTGRLAGRALAGQGARR